MYPNPNIVGWAPHPIVGAVPVVGAPAVGANQVMAAQPAAQQPTMCINPAMIQAWLGSLVHGGQYGQQAVQMAAARVVDPNAVFVDDTSPTKRRRYPLGFDSREDIAAGAAFPIEAFPQTLFRGERLVVPSAIAEDFVINDIIVGKDSQKVAPDPLPAEVFTEVGVDVNLNLDTAQPGVIITLNVTNIDVDPHRFRAAIIGTSVE